MAEEWTGRIRALDGVRGVAVLLVVGYHTLGARRTDLAASTLNTLHGGMWVGVDLFFVLSGFLITGILIDSKGEHGYFRRFYARRSLRIFPLYYASLILVLVVLPVACDVVGRAQPAFIARVTEHQLWLWTYLQNWFQAGGEHRLPGFGHFWSLAVEEQFYIVWPLVVLTLSRRSLLRVCLAAPVVCLGLRIALSAGGVDEWAIRHLTVTRVDTLLIGGALAVAVRDPRLQAWVAAHHRAMLWTGMLSLLAVFVVNGRATYDRDALVVTIGFTAAAVAGAGLVATNLYRPFLDRAALRFFGKYSYAIYVVHPVIAAGMSSLVGRLGPPPVVKALLVLPLTLAASTAVALVSWWLWESRWLALRDRRALRPVSSTV